MKLETRGQSLQTLLGRVICIGTAIVLSTTTMSGCSSGGNLGPPPMPTPVVICIEAQSRELTDFDEFVGRTEPSATVEVQARVAGFLQTVEFDDGQLVAEGDLLATIEPDEYDAIHKQALANIDLWKSKLNLAETSFKRFKELLGNNSVSQAEYDESEAAVSEARSQITAAEAAAARTALDLKYTRIVAPISGRSDRAYVTPGNIVSGGLGAGTLLTRIVDDTPMYAYVDVDEQSVLSYKRRAREAGTNDSASGALKSLRIPCLLKLQDESEFVHEGYLDFAENRVDGATGTIRIRAVYENADRFLTGGLFVRVRIPKGEPYIGVLIPEQCIATDQADKIAYVVNEAGEAELRVLELGSRFGGLRSVISGIEQGELVVYQGIQKVRPGAAVAAEVTPISIDDSLLGVSSMPNSEGTAESPEPEAEIKTESETQTSSEDL
ncbi:MAG: efflux RND transporter periplasmic adaptor subunit [Pirellulaceae bacterium]